MDEQESRIKIPFGEDSMRVIQGKRALVTGAALGIGREIALGLAREGADLFLLDVNQSALNEVVAEAEQHGVEAIGQCCDVSRPEQISASIQGMMQRWGYLDILVNNAGVTFYGPTHNMTAQQWDWLLSINLHAPIQFIRELLPMLLGRPEAHILNVASICGLVGGGKVTAYNVSKFALVGLSEALRCEYGRHGLGVTALCPGFVSTNLFKAGGSTRAGRSAPTPPTWLRTTPQRVAKKAVRAIRRNKRMVLITPLAHLLFNLKRFAPGILDFAGRIGRRRKMKQKAAQGAFSPSPIDNLSPNSQKKKVA